MATTNFVSVSLSVPETRQACVSWLKQQDPYLIANYLEGSENYHHTLAGLATKTHNDETCKALKKENKELMDAMARERTEHLENTKAIRHELTELYNKRLEDTKESIQTMNDTALSVLTQKLKAATEEANRCKGNEALIEQEVTSNMENKVQKLIQQLNTEKTEAQRDRTELQRMLAASNTEKVALAEKYASKLEDNLRKLEDNLRPFYGTSAEKGASGENFLEQTHATLELGVLEKDVGNLNTGYADFTWQYNECTALVENKLAEKLNSVSDIGKFKRDVHDAVNKNRINMALFISLKCRVPGKPMFSLETISGIPVLWASRAASDIMSAELMVKTAFRFMAELWSIYRQEQGTSSAEATMRRLASFVKETTAHHEKISKQIASLEKNSQCILRAINELKKTNELMIEKLQHFDGGDNETQDGSSDSSTVKDTEEDFWISITGKKILTEVSEYLERTKKYPTSLEQLNLDPEEIKKINVEGDVVLHAKEVVRRSKLSTKQKQKRQEQAETSSKRVKTDDAPPSTK